MKLTVRPPSRVRAAPARTMQQSSWADLIDTLLSIYSSTITAHSISQAASQLSQYLARFQSRLKPVHALWIGQTLSILQSLAKVSNDFLATAQAANATPASRSRMVDTTQLISSLGGANDQVNLMELVRYLKESKLARKVSGYVEMSEEEAARKGTWLLPSVIEDERFAC